MNLKRRISVSAAIRQQVGSAANASSESSVRQSALWCILCAEWWQRDWVQCEDGSSKLSWLFAAPIPEHKENIGQPIVAARGEVNTPWLLIRLFLKNVLFFLPHSLRAFQFLKQIRCGFSQCLGGCIAASFSALHVCSNMKHCVSYVCEFCASCATGYYFEVSRFCIALACVHRRDAQQMNIAGGVLWVCCHTLCWKVMEVHSFLLFFVFFPTFFCLQVAGMHADLVKQCEPVAVVCRVCLHKVLLLFARLSWKRANYRDRLGKEGNRVN